MKLLIIVATIATLYINGIYSACTTDPANFNVTAGNQSIRIGWDAAVGSSPITYDFTSSIDSTISAGSITDTFYEFTGLPVGILYAATTRVQATCGGSLSQPLTELLNAGTIPDTPTLSVNSDDNTDINLVFDHNGDADSYVLVNSHFSGGQVSSANNYHFVEKLEKGQTYTFEGYTILNGVESDRAAYTHKVEEDLVWGMSPFLFALMWILVIVLVVVIIIAVLVFCYVYKKRKANRAANGGVSRESTRNLTGEGDEEEEKKPWEYKDPYETADYRLTDTQRKRAFAIAAQKAAIAS